MRDNLSVWAIVEILNSGGKYKVQQNQKKISV